MVIICMVCRVRMWFHQLFQRFQLISINSGKTQTLVFLSDYRFPRKENWTTKMLFGYKFFRLMWPFCTPQCSAEVRFIIYLWIMSTENVSLKKVLHSLARFGIIPSLIYLHVQSHANCLKFIYNFILFT